MDRQSNAQSALIIACVSGVTLLTTLLSGATTVALPSIGAALKIPDASLQWPLSMYALVNGTFLLVAGALADMLGRKTLFLIGTSSFAVVALATSFAKTSLSYMILMSLLGLPAAILAPAGAGILGSVFPSGSVRTAAFASLGAGQPVGYIIGLLAGGLLAKHWEGIYWLLGSLSAILAFTAFFVLPKDAGQSNIWPQLRDFDWIGAILSAAASITLIFALSDAPSAPDGWSTPYIPALLPTSATFLVSFLWLEEKRERDNRHVLLPLSVWKAKSLGTMVATVFFAWASFNTLSYLTTLMYQQVQHVSPMRTAIYNLPTAFGGFVLNVIAGRLTGKVSTIRLIVAGLTLSIASCVIFSVVRPSASYWKGMLWVMLSIVGPDLFFSAGNILIQNSVSSSQQALAGSMFMISTRLATSFGLSVASAIATAATSKYAKIHPIPTMVDFNDTAVQSSQNPALDAKSLAILEGLRAGGWVCLGFTLLSLATAVAGLRGADLITKRSQDETPTNAEPVELQEGRGSLSAADMDATLNASYRSRNTAKGTLEDRRGRQ